MAALQERGIAVNASDQGTSKILTIAIPSYNAERYLDNCLSHFIDSNVLEHLEILIVNDGSTDSTEAMARAYEQRYPESITVISKENGGHGSTINAAIPRSTGKYFKVVDVDDWVESDTLDLLVRALATADVDLVLNPSNIYHEGMGKTQLFYKRLFHKFPSLEKHDFSELTMKTAVSIHEVIFRTAMLQAHPTPIDEHTYYVDAEYVLYNLAHVSTFMMCNRPLYVYRFGSATQSVSHANLMKNVEQHHRVAMSCLTYWNENRGSMDEAHRRCFYVQLSRVISDHYHIYLDFPPGRDLLRVMRKWHVDTERLMTSEAKPTVGPLIAAMILVNFHGLYAFWLVNQVRLFAMDVLIKFFMTLKPASEGYLVKMFMDPPTTSQPSHA